MSTYINKKTRLFKRAGDPEVHRKRSEGRLKTYPSETDPRSWCTSREDRRQHILELIRRGWGRDFYQPGDIITGDNKVDSDYLKKFLAAEDAKVKPVEEKLLATIAELEAELDNLKNDQQELLNKANQYDDLQDEYEDLKRKYQELVLLLKQKDADRFPRDAAELDNLKQEIDRLKKELSQKKAEEGNCDELRQKVAALEKERRMLLEEIEDCDCCITCQNKEMARLARLLDCLLANLDRLQK